jgi:hypothetical protein
MKEIKRGSKENPAVAGNILPDITVLSGDGMGIRKNEVFKAVFL